MKIDRSAVSAFFLTSPEGRVNLLNIADGASTKAALQYILNEFDTSPSARRRIRASIRTTEWYAVMVKAISLSHESENSKQEIPIETPKKEESSGMAKFRAGLAQIRAVKLGLAPLVSKKEDWGPEWAYEKFVLPVKRTINWEAVPMSDVPHKAQKIEVPENDSIPPPAEWEDLAHLLDAIEALQCADRVELFEVLPSEYPFPGQERKVLSTFKLFFERRRFERQVETQGIVNDAIKLVTSAMPVQALHLVTACSPSGDENEESSFQKETKEELGIGTLADLKKKLAQRKAALPRKRGRVEEFKEAGQSRYAPEGGLKICEEDIFMSENIVKRWLPKSQEPKKPDDVKIMVAHPVQHEVVKYSASDGPIFKALPRMAEEQLRKLLEKGWKGQTSVCCDLSIVSHVGYGTPLVVFVALLDTRTTNAEESYLAGSYVDIGRMKASMLTMPLINLPMGQTIEDMDNFLGGLCLAFYYQNVKGFRPGIPLLSYGAVEFSELTAATNYRTKTKDSWEQIVRDDKHDRRVIAGLNALQVLEKDLNEPIPDLGEIVVSVPTTAVQLPLYIREGRIVEPVQEKSKSLKIPPMRVPQRTGRLSFGGGSGGVCSRQTDVTSKPTSDDDVLGQSTAPKHTVTPFGKVANKDFLFNRKVKVKKDSKRGSVLGVLNLFQEINRSQTRKRIDWMADGLVFPKFNVSIKTTSNQFIGMSIGIALDWFGKFPDKTELLPTVANEFPGLGPIVLNQNEHNFVIDVREQFGSAMSLVTDLFSVDPKLIFYVITTNQVVQCHDWTFFLEVSLDYEKTTEFRGTPLFTYPIGPRDVLQIDRIIGNYSVAGNDAKGILIPLHLARALDTDLGNKYISPWRVYLEHFMGFGGNFIFEYIPCSSAMISCGLRACMWYNVDTFPTIAEVSQLEHEELDGRKEFSLNVRAPRGKLATSRNVSKLAIMPITGVTAPDSVAKDFEFIIKLRRIENLHLGPRIFPTEWYQLFWIDSFKKDDFKLSITGHVADIKSSDVDVLINPGIFSHMIACTGMHEGQLDVRATWSYTNKLGNVEGHVTFLHGFGEPRKLTGNATVVTNSSGIYEANQIQVGSLAGPVASNEADINKWIEIHFWKGTQIEQFHVCVRPHAGFSFYGDACFATKVLESS